MPQYGEVRVDYITYTTGVAPNEGNVTVPVSGLVNAPTFSGDVIIEGDLEVNGDLTVSGDINASGVTISGFTGLFASGTAASPSISFVGDENTGLYSPGADQLALSTNGTGRLFVDGTGLTKAVGTANTVLDVENSGNTYQRIGFYGTGTSLKGRVGTSTSNANILIEADPSNLAASSSVQFSVDGSERLRITSAGLVGIGTSAPPSQLTVSKTAAGAEGATLAIQNTGSGANTSVALHLVPNPGGGNDVARSASIKSRQTLIGNYADLGFFTANSDTPQERLTIGANGRVGIGVTSPDYKLDVLPDSAGATLRVRGGSGGTGIIQFTDDIASAQWGTLSATSGSLDVGHSSVVRFYTSSSERARIDGSGRLGIGTSAPGRTLHVNSSFFNPVRIQSSQPNSRIEFQDSGTDSFDTVSIGSDGNDFQINTNTTGGGSRRVTVKADGKVGIGTTDPGTKLVVQDFSDLTLNANTIDYTLFLEGGFTQGDGQYGASLAFNRIGDANRTGAIIAAKQTTADPDQVGIAFLTHASATTNTDLIEQMLITHDGKVGIGTTNPGAKLDVAGNLRFSAASPVIELNNGGPQIFVPGANTLAFATGGGIGTPTERARIDSSGRLLVGTSSWSTDHGVVVAKSGTNSDGSLFVGKYDNVMSSGDFAGQVAFGSSFDGNIGALIKSEADANWTHGSSHPSRLVFSTTADGASSPTERMRIRSDGTLLYAKTSSSTGESTPGVIFFGRDASGTYGKGRIGVTHDSTASWFSRVSSDGNVITFHRGAVTAVGSISVTTTATAYNTSSDYRLKENVTPMTGAADRVKALKPCRFNFIADPDTTVDGFLAHEVQDIVPEAITGEKDAVDDEGNPQYQGIDQSKMVPLVVAALQEAIAKIETLEQRLNDAGIN